MCVCVCVCVCEYVCMYVHVYKKEQDKYRTHNISLHPQPTPRRQDIQRQPIKKI